LFVSVVPWISLLRFVPKLDVAGSTPVARSTISSRLMRAQGKDWGRDRDFRDVRFHHGSRRGFHSG
jgi:hypothetical protein